MYVRVGHRGVPNYGADAASSCVDTFDSLRKPSSVDKLSPH